MSSMKNLLSTDQKGITLVELLSVLVLISLVTGIIWTTLNISVKHNVVETTKLKLQQEANAVITKLQYEHRRKDCYRLISTKNEIFIQGCEDVPSFKNIISSGYFYEASEYENSLSGDDTYKSQIDVRVEPKRSNLNNLYLKIIDKNNPKLSLTIQTSVTRYQNK